MARSVSDIAMFNKIFSVCNSTLPNVNLTGMRIGYATNWWANLGPEVRRPRNEADAVPPITSQRC